MKKKKANRGSWFTLSLAGINIVYVLALCVVILPLLLVANYNYPSADDWSYGKAGYQVIAEGGGLVAVLKSAIQTTVNYYMEWEGRFTNAFLASLQPGIWGEEYYAVVPWMMLGGLILGEVVLFGTLLGSFKKDSDKCRKWLLLPVVAPTLIMQILYTPSTIESFYWYTGAVNYTFIFALSMVLFALFFKLATGEARSWRLGLQVFWACLLAIFIGGDNYATSLSTVVAMVILCIIFWIYNRRGFYRTWYLPVLTGGCLVACILAPGNATRLNTSFAGGTTGNAFGAVWASLVRSFINIYSWTNWKVILMLLLIAPIAWMAVKYVKFDFRLPGIFTILSFGVYASQITATLYVDGTTGGGRMAAILYYSYHVWVVGNLCYLIGWLRRVLVKCPESVQTRMNRVAEFVRRFLLPYCALVGVLLMGIIYSSDRKEISSYKAYRDWRQGWAQQYAKEWDARLEVLHDERITVVEFAPIGVQPESYVYTDLQPEDGYTWVNKDCAAYYGKESIMVVESAEVKTE